MNPWVLMRIPRNTQIVPYDCAARIDCQSASFRKCSAFVLEWSEDGARIVDNLETAVQLTDETMVEVGSILIESDDLACGIHSAGARHRHCDAGNHRVDRKESPIRPPHEAASAVECDALAGGADDITLRIDSP